MNILILSVTTILMVICVFLYSSYIGVFQSKLSIRQCAKYKSEPVCPYSGIKMILILLVCAAIYVAFFFVSSLVPDAPLLVTTRIKLSVLYYIVFAAAVIDSKRKIIPNALILFGILFRACMYIYEFFKVDIFETIIKSDLIGFAIGFGLLAFVSVITRQGIGFGDAKLFAVIGLIGGVSCTISTLFISLLVSAVASAVFLLTRKKDKKGTFPFGPCVAVGCVVTLLLSNY